jgi:hypothetical protein
MADARSAQDDGQARNGPDKMRRGKQFALNEKRNAVSREFGVIVWLQTTSHTYPMISIKVIK